MPEGDPDSSTDAEVRLLSQALVTAWDGFFARFRPDEQDFERVPYQEEAAQLSSTIQALRTNQGSPGASHALIIELLESFANRRFEEQNRRIDELMDLCEQMRQRLEMTELTKSHLEDEFSHCHAIVKTALERHRLGPPTGLNHTPRLHNLFNHLLSHFEPRASRMDTESFKRTPEAAKRAEEAGKDEPVFDYERLRRLFRKKEP